MKLTGNFIVDIILWLCFFPFILGYKAFKFGWKRNKLITGLATGIAIVAIGILGGGDEGTNKEASSNKVEPTVSIEASVKPSVEPSVNVEPTQEVKDTPTPATSISPTNSPINPEQNILPVASVKPSTKPITQTTTQQNRVEALVIRVVDGDTFEIQGGQKVRLIGVNTPESTTKHEPYGEEASAYTKSQLLNKKVYLEKDVSETDRYGRLLRYVYLANGIMFNELLVKEGYANVATYPPDVKYKDKFIVAERSARENNLGLWNVTSPTPLKSSPTPTISIKPTPAQNNTTTNETKYVGSIESDKYHFPSCSSAKTITTNNLITFKDKAEAENKGYKPCGRCKPQ